MLRYLLTLLAFLGLSSGAMAGSSIRCTGSKDGHSVVLTARVPGSLLTTLGRASGTVWVDGRSVADFEEGDMDVSVVWKTFKGKNDRGDYLNGKVTDLDSRRAIIYNLKVPSFGIYLYNISVNCK